MRPKGNLGGNSTGCAARAFGARIFVTTSMFRPLPLFIHRVPGAGLRRQPMEWRILDRDGRNNPGNETSPLHHLESSGWGETRHLVVWPGRLDIGKVHLALRHRREAAAVERGWAVGTQRPEMLGCRVADIGVPAVVRVSLGMFAHQAVAVFLGQDRRSRDAGLTRIAADDRASGPAPFGTASGGSKVTVDKHLMRVAADRLAQPLHRHRHGPHRRLEDVERVDVLDLDYSDTE